MKIDKMPTTILLLIFSWLIAILGIFMGGYIIIIRFGDLNALIKGSSILLGGLFLATLIRMLGNIGQMMFDLSHSLQALENSIEQIGCDSRDVKQNIHQIKTFFEQIERHLDLKK